MRTTLILVAIIAIAFIIVNYYRYIFAETVEGEIVGVERVTDPTMVMSPNITADQMYSFAIAIRDTKTGKIYTASTVDRQWAVAKKGFCAKAKFYPYPPWDLEKDGTYNSARLVELRDCNHLLDDHTKAEALSKSNEAIPTPVPSVSQGAPAKSSP